MRITKVPNMALAMTDTTEYFSSAGNDVNGFQYGDVNSSVSVHTIRSVHFAHGFSMVFILD